ncbi:vWA domain-containing protein [Singulisphaera acidiphila]|uniref:N-terminal double-transmembrane domain-containing protein n=2 Tax=Singulisphaera acidiphila TaxID=466153 RepID=L0D6F8_SINAD|nr:VWA domain-containing protein [Singulisphaera acidiphila]AGA24842.1 N-terminal double-transmembrane domain-containing protein [Singulisphaera acidiphila DSM 18658]
MSFLTPLYALGLLALAAPILFHLIQRKPRGEVPFSSLMFLTPTPPRLTRRSRLDNLLLLLLRAAALTLLALAFARPFLRQAANLDYGNVARRRVAVVIDTSASMRRGDLWPKAKKLAEEAIAACRPADQLALFAFDGASRPLLSFHESATLDPSRRQAVATALVERLEPTWGGTQLGQALIDAVAAIEDVADTSEKAGRMPRRIVLISDLQQGSRLEALGGFEWPSDVELDLKTVTDLGSNASLHALADGIETEHSKNAPGRRVGVTNEPGSTREKFQVVRVDEKGSETGPPIDVYVPPGESRVVRLPKPQGESAPGTLRLKGDTHPFDNTLYSADEHREEATVLYVGKDEPDDPAGLLYYLERVFHDTPRRRVTIRTASPAVALTLESTQALPLVILTAETTTENARKLHAYGQSGGTVLDVVTTAGKAETLATLLDVAPWEIEEGAVKRDLMLGEIAFDHPLFSALAGAQYNDFTKIHFWKYRRISTDPFKDARILARFENGDPAIVEQGIGKGRVIVLASGWNPNDSQLARSSKFVPLMAALLEGRDARPATQANLLVHDPVALPVTEGAAKGLVVRTPGGGTVATAPGRTAFLETDRPGLYTIETAAGAREFAVNLDPLESKTAPLHVETLEQFGCRLANPSRTTVDRDHLRQMHNAELEGRQKLWRWLIVAAIGILIVETWLAGRQTAPRSARAEALTT